VEDSVGLLTISADYLPPRQKHITDFCNSLGRLFIAGGNYNAKLTVWGSGLITPEECELLKTKESNNLTQISTGEPTYWLSDRNKLQDLVDLFVTEGIRQDFDVAKSCFDLSSDHSPILIILKSNALNLEKYPSWNNKHKFGCFQTPRQ
jgi:hypothetical protein